MPDEQDSTSTPESDDLSQLELPKLFRRRKPRPEPEAAAVGAPEPPAEQEAAADSEAEVADVPELPAAEAPAVEEAPPAEDEPTREVATEPRAPRRFSVRRARKDPAPVPPQAETEPEQVPVPEPEPEPMVLPEAPAAEPEPAVAEPGPAAPVTVEEPATWQPSGRVEPEPGPEPDEDLSPAATEAAEPAEPAGPTGPSRLQQLADLRLPHLAGHWAAAVTGAVSGLVGVLLVVAAQALSQAVRGTSNAGAAGVFLVVGIIAVCVVLGAAGLRAWGQTETLSTSFLGTGLVVVVVMLFLLPVIFSWVMVLVVPVLGALAFALSWWVSHRLGPEARKVNDEYSPEVHR